jgi:DNA-binding NarL/FixJ family response regulator
MEIFSRSNMVILADSQESFRSAAAKTLATDGRMFIVAQCMNLDQMYKAITTYPGSIVVFAASLQPDFDRVLMLLEATGSRGIVVAENNERPAIYLLKGFQGVIFRNANESRLTECVHRVAANEFWQPLQLMKPDSNGEDAVGTRVRDPRTSDKLQLLSKVSIGLCTRLKMGVGESMRPFGSR